MQLNDIIASFKGLQHDICRALERLDGAATFDSDKWERREGGGGDTRPIQNGRLIEKGGVNFSHVFGKMPEPITRKLKLPENSPFHATGVSIVLHPLNPYMPIIHMNVRYFEASENTYWFGGGIDVSPAYIDFEDAKSFHLYLKEICDRHDEHYYEKFKSWCDEYFYLPHRKESRGIGGIFFDQLGREDEGRNRVENHFKFVMDVAEAFVPIYQKLAKGNRAKIYGENEQRWQGIRRSRYVEFNLLHDKGTKFGLDTGGRTESILMSMPPRAEWEYNFQPKPGSPEAFTQENLKVQNWLDLGD